MLMPDQIEIDADKFTKLLEVTKWYDVMPESVGDDVGERFHENIWELKLEQLPDFDGQDDFFVVGTTIEEGKLYVQLITNEPDAEPVNVPIISKGE